MTIFSFGFLAIELTDMKFLAEQFMFLYKFLPFLSFLNPPVVLDQQLHLHLSLFRRIIFEKLKISDKLLGFWIVFEEIFVSFGVVAQI